MGNFRIDSSNIDSQTWVTVTFKNSNLRWEFQDFSAKHDTISRVFAGAEERLRDISRRQLSQDNREATELGDRVQNVLLDAQQLVQLLNQRFAKFHLVSKSSKFNQRNFYTFLEYSTVLIWSESFLILNQFTITRKKEAPISGSSLSKI